MINRELREEKIASLKKELSEKYVYIMSFILSVFSLYFIYIVPNSFMFSYALGGGVGLLILWITLRNSVDLNTLVRIYLIIAPIYNLLVMVQYWSVSLISFIWLIPIPIGAYIFFSKREVVFFSIYALTFVTLVALVSNYYSSHQNAIIPSYTRFSDVIIIIANIIVVLHLINYKMKIQNLELLTVIEEIEKIDLPISFDKKEIEQYNTIFKELDELVVSKKLYKDSNLNVSMLSTMLSVNNTYISRSIKYQGFNNFNSYINSYRVESVIKSIKNNELEKHTMLHIYTDAGFNSQSTFNRVFKEIKRITPSEYFLQYKDNIDNI